VVPAVTTNVATQTTIPATTTPAAATNLLQAVAGGVGANLAQGIINVAATGTAVYSTCLPSEWTANTIDVTPYTGGLWSTASIVINKLIVQLQPVLTDFCSVRGTVVKLLAMGKKAMEFLGIKSKKRKFRKYRFLQRSHVTRRKKNGVSDGLKVLIIQLKMV